MSKFKIGDRVRVTNAECTRATEVGGVYEVIALHTRDGVYVRTEVDGVGEGGCAVPEIKPPFEYLYGRQIELVSDVPSDEIHITTKGRRVIAIQKRDGKGVKRAEAVCAPDDTFDFNTGAQLAFNRLVYGTDYHPAEVKLTTTGDKPEPKYKVGDKVKVINQGKRYTTYVDWFSENEMWQLKRRYEKTNQSHISNGDVLKIVAAGRHGTEDVDMFAIENDEGIFLIGEKGIEPYTEPTQEPIKLYCVKDDEDYLTKGKIYEFTPSKYFVYDHCKSALTYSNLDDFFKDYGCWKNRLVPLASRPAKVGEWVRFKEYYGGELELGTLHKATAVYGETVEFECGCNCSVPKMYEVLDGYTREPEYYSGKVVCVEWNGANYTPGKVYNVVDGYMKNNFGGNASARFKMLKDVLNYSGKFIEFVEG